MRKTYLFDTSALIDDPNAWKLYPLCDLIIPMTVLEELDDLKKQAGQTGRNARVSLPGRGGSGVFALQNLLDGVLPELHASTSSVTRSIRQSD